MVSLHIETARFKSPGHKNELCFFWDTLLEGIFLRNNHPKGKVHEKKVKKTSVSFMYVSVAENAELFFTFFLHLPHKQFSFRREVLNRHTPPPPTVFFESVCMCKGKTNTC